MPAWILGCGVGVAMVSWSEVSGFLSFSFLKFLGVGDDVGCLYLL